MNMLSVVFGLPFATKSEIENVRLNIAASLLGIVSHFSDLEPFVDENGRALRGLAPETLVGGLDGSIKVLKHAHTRI